MGKGKVIFMKGADGTTTENEELARMLRRLAIYHEADAATVLRKLVEREHKFHFGPNAESGRRAADEMITKMKSTNPAVYEQIKRERDQRIKRALKA